MALDVTQVKLMELKDAKIFKLTTDTVATLAYATATELEGITKILVSPKPETKKLIGDSETKDIYQRITEIEFSGEMSFLSLDVLAIMFGGVVSQTGTTPNQVAKWSFTPANARSSYFKIVGKWDYAGDGLADAHVTLFKCKITEVPELELPDASGNFGTIKFKGIAVPTKHAGEWYDIELHEAATPIT
jgi:hypothetical protein